MRVCCSLSQWSNDNMSDCGVDSLCDCLIYSLELGLCILTAVLHQLSILSLWVSLGISFEVLMVAVAEAAYRWTCSQSLLAWLID